MYKLFATASVFIRQFMLPNPFDEMTTPVTMTYHGSNLNFSPELLNYISEPFLVAFTFLIVRLYYTRNYDSPVKGSILFLAFYFIHTALLSVIARFNFSQVAVLIVVGIYLFCQICVLVLRNSVQMNT